MLCKSKDPLTGNVVDTVLTVTDQLSWYTQAFILKDQSVDTVIKTLDRCYFTYFYYPKIICSDAGSVFTSKAWSEYCQKVGMSHRVASISHHEAQTFVELRNKHISTALRCTLLERQSDWASELANVVRSLNWSVSSVTQQSPAELFLGRRPITAAFFQLPPNSAADISQDTHIKRTENAGLAVNIAQEETQRNWAVNDKYWKCNSNAPTFHVGQTVLLYSESVPAGYTGKLFP